MNRSASRLVFPALLAALSFLAGASVDWRATAQTATESNNAELTRLFTEDQADRKAGADWHAVGERDARRLARVKELYREAAMKTGADFYHAAMVLQHSTEADDYLLAHELAVTAAIKGDDRGRWLAAASEDRFLMSIDRPQRFGTQYRTEGHGAGPMKLYKVDPAVTDALRREFKVPTLADARAREAQINKR